MPGVIFFWRWCFGRKKSIADYIKQWPWDLWGDPKMTARFFCCRWQKEELQGHLAVMAWWGPQDLLTIMLPLQDDCTGIAWCLKTSEQHGCGSNSVASLFQITNRYRMICDCNLKPPLPHAYRYLMIFNFPPQDTWPPKIIWLPQICDWCIIKQRWQFTDNATYMHLFCAER